MLWLYALFSLLAIHEAQLSGNIRHLNIDPSAISNIQLLIPVALPAARPHPEHDEHAEHAEHDEHDERYTFMQRQDEDEDENGSVPAYASTLDAESEQRPRAIPMQLPKAVNSRSIYLGNLLPRYDSQSMEESEEGPGPVRASQERCRLLANRQKGRARELVLYLCEELIDVTATRCDCNKPSRDGSVFGPLGGRRESQPAPEGLRKRSAYVL